VIAWLGTVQFPELQIQTVIEREPLGTGGALAYSRPHLVSDPVLVLNGDTLAGADLGAFLQAYCMAGSEACIMCVKVEDAGRYGMVEIDETDRVVRFVEKVNHVTGANWINAGFYLFGSGFLDRLARTLTKGSLERDVLERMPPGFIGAFRTSARFLDIGTPETLAIASEIIELKT
jgi:mannose-1-phosphate guanylyltransferase